MNLLVLLGGVEGRARRRVLDHVPQHYVVTRVRVHIALVGGGRWVVGWSLGRLVGWSVGRLVGWSGAGAGAGAGGSGGGGVVVMGMVTLSGVESVSIWTDPRHTDARANETTVWSTLI